MICFWLQLGCSKKKKPTMRLFIKKNEKKKHIDYSVLQYKTINYQSFRRQLVVFYVITGKPSGWINRYFTTTNAFCLTFEVIYSTSIHNTISSLKVFFIRYMFVQISVFKPASWPIRPFFIDNINLAVYYLPLVCV